MIRYYPLNRVKTNLRTNGSEFLLNGQPYRGYYYITYDGNAFTGKDPVQGPSLTLSKIEIPKPSTNVQNGPIPGVENDVYNNIAVPSLQVLPTFQTPQPFFPQPTDTDYKRGSITRYFAKKRDQAGFVIEVNKETHDSLKNTDSVYDYITYEAISTFWQITGPLYDNRVNKQYAVAGIIDTNKRLIDLKEPGFPGLKAFIGEDYAKFAKPVGS